jgi:D-alanyl-D-alanine carboxypeptidase/D-alanyl-D-alanine-endopeptidase (penicillin-binding protein 4)
MPTRDRGLVWFTIINRGPYVPTFRSEQDKFLQRLLKQLQIAQSVPGVLTPHSGINYVPQLGAAHRNEILFRS